MKVDCLQQALSDGLGLASRATTSRPTADSVAQGVLLEAAEGQLKLTCVDLEGGTSIVTWINAKIEKEGAIVLPWRTLKELIDQLPAKEDITIEATEKPLGARVGQDFIDAKVYGHDSDDFTKLHLNTDGTVVKFTPDALAKALKRVLPAVSKEDSRPILTGVKMELAENKFTLAAADGYRLTVDKGALADKVENPIDIVLPGKAMKDLQSMIENLQSDIEMQVTENQNQVVFTMEHGQLIMQLMQGNFPNYAKLVPTEHNTQITLSLNEFRRAVRISTAFVRDNNGIIRIVAKTDGGASTLTVSAQSEDTGENEIEIKAEKDGEDIKCAFNYRFLNDLLDNIEGDSIVFSTLSASSAGLFKTPAIEEYRHVIMPMFVQW